MERRKRNLLVVLIGIVIVVAMVSSFGLGLFAPDTAKIVPGAVYGSQETRFNLSNT